MAEKANNIFLIEDDGDQHFIFELAIKTINAKVGVEPFYNGYSALDRITDTGSATPRLIFLDINLPVMDGYEFMAHINNYSHYKDIPIIVVSMASHSEYKHGPVPSNVSKWLLKHPSFDHFCEEIKEVLADHALL